MYSSYYRIADITIEVQTDEPVNSATFGNKFEAFKLDAPTDDRILFRLHFEDFPLSKEQLGVEITRQEPWKIYLWQEKYVYTTILPDGTENLNVESMIFDETNHVVDIYHPASRRERFMKGNFQSLSMIPTDQVILNRFLPGRDAVSFHSAAIGLGGKSILFIGHSGAGKSTTSTIMSQLGTILCDDRNIVRFHDKTPFGYGTWHHGDVPDVSYGGLPLAGIFFLRQSPENRAELIEDSRLRNQYLLEHVVKPFQTKSWWDSTLSVIEKISRTTPCWNLYFRKDLDPGVIINTLG